MSLADKLAHERRARLAAEQMLELKQAELREANKKLGAHAKALTDEISETRAEVASVRDENRRVKLDLTEAQIQTEIAERRLWHSIETIQDGFAVFDADSRLIMANGAYFQPFEGLEEIREGVEYARILQLMAEEGIVDTGELSAAEWQSTMVERWHSDTHEPTIIRLWNDQFIKVIDQRGLGNDVVSLALNITESVRNQKNLEDARHVAEAANRAKSAFLANMSHEIRTPMNGVVGMAELLSETSLSEEQELYVKTIKNSGEALLVIINDVLDYSKIEADRLVLVEEPFDLEQCIQEIMMLLQPKASEKKIDLLLDYDLFMPTQFVGDPGRLRQILTNLIGNAVKFTTDGHVLIRVTGNPAKEPQISNIHITVEDTGIGIPANKIKHIFGEFNQVEDERNRQFEGTGLGLAISKRLVDLMKGEIWAASDVGAGSCFGLKLPLTTHNTTPSERPAIPDDLKRALVVEVPSVSRDILVDQLSRIGLTVSCHDTAADARDHISVSDLLVISDDLPDNSAAELLNELRNRGSMVPTLIVCTQTGEHLGASVLDQAQGVLRRPISRSGLLEKLQGLKTAPQTPDLNIPASAAEQAAPAPSGGRLMRILAAEDNKTNQLVFRKMVKTLSIDLLMVANGLEAVEAYQSFDPDLIFMDISMPKMDGTEATQKIRKLEEASGRHVPIVALTAHTVDGDKQDILAAGLDHYMSKPLRKADLHNMITEQCPADVVSPTSPQSVAAE